MPTEVKICGLSDEEGVDAAIDAGADYVGFVFFSKSPRHVSLVRAVELASRARGRARIVALNVDAPDDFLDQIASELRPDFLQLHGAETAERVAEVRARTGIPIMKAVGVGGSDDLPATLRYSADLLVLDAKAPPGAARPGGNGIASDWSILAGYSPPAPWLLSGGLDPSNVGRAVASTGASGVDVSSGVESAPGRKDPALIQAFIAAVRGAARPPQRLAG